MTQKPAESSTPDMQFKNWSYSASVAHKAWERGYPREYVAEYLSEDILRAYDAIEKEYIERNENELQS